MESRIPTQPGTYLWTEWNEIVEVKFYGKKLGFEFRGRRFTVTPRLAGKFINTESPEHMDNQHRQIKGYRELDQNEIAQINFIKEQGVALGKAVEHLKNNSNNDKRWIAIGETHLQQGLMALTRAVAKPDFF